MLIIQECTESLQKKKEDYWGREPQVHNKPTHARTHKHTHASEKSLMLMCSERQRWCIRWSVELAVSQTVLPCQLVQTDTALQAVCRCLSGDSRAFLLRNPEFRPIGAAAFQYFMTCKPSNTAEQFISGSQRFRITFKKKIRHPLTDYLWPSLSLKGSLHDMLTISISICVSSFFSIFRFILDHFIDLSSTTMYATD